MSAAAGAGAGAGGDGGAAYGKGPLLEYSVVYTDRAQNLMSSPFCEAMRDISASLKAVYHAHSVALIPGSGTYAMEACAWAFGLDKKALIIRNGYFSFRWSDINACSGMFASEVVMKARAVGDAVEGTSNRQFAPCPIEEVIAKIAEERPGVVFAPHVETATGILLPDSYIKAVAEAAHAVDAVFVLDGIAAGNVWCNMEALGVDAYISAPQKGWSGPACCGLVMLSPAGREKAMASAGQRTSFCCNLVKWLTVMDKYDAGAFMYYTTLPTDPLMAFRDVIKELEEFGLEKAQTAMNEIGTRARKELAARGYVSAAADGFGAPGVVVVFSPTEGMVGKFKANGIQIAGGVPWKVDEDTLHSMNTRASTFRLGLFGLDKLKNVDRTITTLTTALDAIASSS